MNFGPLQIATLWRLSKANAACNALVVEGVRELRLILVEDGQIVHWERFATAGLLRRRASDLLRKRTQTGWCRTAVSPDLRLRPARRRLFDAPGPGRAVQKPPAS